MADSDTKVQQFLLLAKSVRGRALCELINKATAEPGLFAFGELLDMPNIAELRNSAEHAPYVRLLELFCYGTWPDYAAQAAALPPLSEQQRHKLKQLTVVSLATESKLLAYDRLMGVLELGSTRELEDFLITSLFYAGALHGRLDPARGALEVHRCISRDVRPAELPKLAAALEGWLANATDMLALLESTAAAASSGAEAARARRAALDKRQEEARRAGGRGGGGGGGGDFGGDFGMDDADMAMAYGAGGGSGGGGGARPKRVRGKRGWQDGGGAP